MEEKLIKIEVNLQQSIIWTGSEGVSNAICAITHRHRKVVVIRPEYRQIQKEILALVDFKSPCVLYGDSFSVDTWDRRIDAFLRERVLIEQLGNVVDTSGAELDEGGKDAIVEEMLLFLRDRDE